MTNFNTPKRVVGSLIAGLLGILASSSSMSASEPDAVAKIAAASGSSVTGTVTFFRLSNGGVHVDANIAGLTPGEHGFHVHEFGDCNGTNASRAGGHFNPTAMDHGSQDGEHHAGDMQNMVADADGKAHYSGDFPSLAIGSGDRDVLGKSVIIHESPDDYKTQPAGNSGKRVGCGVIMAP